METYQQLPLRLHDRFSPPG